MTEHPQFAIERLAYVSLTTPDAAGLCNFFERAMGFRLLTAGRVSAQELVGISGSAGGAYRVTLGLGGEVIELLQFDSPGRPYPARASVSDLCFQHFAVVVTDMALAYQHICSLGGWSAISTDGPQHLPSSSGGVTAFKFRDPDGHPLELLAFPAEKVPSHWKSRSRNELFLGIDHSAISVFDSARSIAFYRGLGLRVAARSQNSGPAQAQLDGVSRPHVDVTALEPRQATPHLELLGYRFVTQDEKIELRNNDVAATRLVFEARQSSAGGAAQKRGLIDPDGHHLLIVDSIEDESSQTANAQANAGSRSVFAKPESVR
ncbi:VOC family protein [Bradyrhizobium sp.]|jgi:catechol 2,3-dioxygenase-like lactoylglutathione lyase family enzyme|uniref:VOC family protein n=1 Tax=Bradyrhizobium sp. TaxID=376 RepID=UPI003C270E63